MNREEVMDDFVDEVEFEFPWVGGNVRLRWPASKRTALQAIVAVLVAVVLLVPSSLYILFVAAQAENVAQVGQIFGTKPTPTPPALPPSLEPGKADPLPLVEAP